MRSVTHQNAAALHLLKTFLEALPSRANDRIDSEGKALLEELRSAQPPAPALRAETHPDSQLPLTRSASVAAEPQPAQMLATHRVEGAAALRALVEISGDGGGRRDSAAAPAWPEEPGLAQSQPAMGGGSTPWLSEAMAAYSARQRELLALHPGVQPTGVRPGARFHGDGVRLSPLKLLQKALLCACVIAVVVFLLIRHAPLG